MAEPIQRRGVGQQLQEVRRATPSGRTVDTTYQTRGVEEGADRGSQILQTVLNAAGQGLQAAGQEFKKKIESDKVRQMNNALMGLQPSDDSTQAGYVAHGAVAVQNEVLKETKRLTDLAASYEGTDEEWQEEVVASRTNIQEGIFNSYPNLTEPSKRDQFLGVITNSFLEQSPKIAMARMTGKIEQERKSRLNTFQGNLLQTLDGLEEGQVEPVISALLTDKRKALQLTPEEAESVLVEAAINAANDGDTRLIEFTKTYGGDVSLYDRDGKLQQADKRGQGVWAAKNAGAVAIAKDALQAEFYQGNISWPQFAAEAEKLNAKTGNSAYTDDQIIAVKNARQRELAAKVDISGYIEQGNKASTVGGQPVGVTIQDDKTKDAVVDAKAQEFSLISNAILKANPAIADDPQAVRLLRNKETTELASWLIANQLTNKGWKEQLSTITNYNVDNVDPDASLPDNVTDVFNLWQTMPEGSKIDHADPKTFATFSNYEAFKAQGKTDQQALSLAQKAVRSGRTFGSAELKSMKSAAASAASELTSGSWLPFDSAPDWYTDTIAVALENATRVNMKAGYVDIEKAAKDAASAFKRHYTTLDNGQLVFGDRTTLASQMKVNPSDIELTLDTYLEMNREALLDNAGGAGLDELYYDVVPGRGIAYVRSGINGMPVSPPLILSELKVGRDDYLNQREATRLEKLERARLDRTFAVPTQEQAVAGMEVLERGLGNPAEEEIDGWSGAARLNEKMPLRKEDFEESQQRFKSAMMEVENSVKAGFNKQAGVWNPHTSLEGGTDTLAYGHKLTKAEMKRGYIELDGKRYKFTDGDSEITEQVAVKLMEKDLEKAEAFVKKNWKSYEGLPEKYQRVLVNLQFNTGGAIPSNWPKLRKAMLAGDDATVRQEMITSYSSEGGDKVILEQRAQVLADALGIK